MGESVKFKSFFMGGYECADHVNRYGERVNLLRATAHDRLAASDYEALTRQNIWTVREGICWSSCEPRAGEYDFSEVLRRIRAGHELGVQQIWDICHFGFPDDLSPSHPAFARRFARVCREFARCYRSATDAALFVVPINEISYLSWLGGDARGTVPFMKGAGWDLKYHLCVAAIRGIEAILEVDPAARILTVEPLIHIHPGPSDDGPEVGQHNDFQYQAMDIIGGRLCPEAGGKPGYLDILGFNYYYNCQWVNGGEPLPWPAEPSGRVPLSRLLLEAAVRFGRPVVLSETGHYGPARAQWLRETVVECGLAMANGVPLQGICLYPVVDRPDWDHLHKNIECGLFSVDDSTKERFLNIDYAQALQDGIASMRAPAGARSARSPADPRDSSR